MLFSYLKWKHKSIWILITIWIIIPTLTAWFLNTHNKSAFLHRLHGVKVKLSYKIEGLERLFFQLIKEKSTNLDKFPNWTTTKYWIPPFLFRLLKFQKKFPPLTCPVWNLGPFTKVGRKLCNKDLYRKARAENLKICINPSGVDSYWKSIHSADNLWGIFVETLHQHWIVFTQS